MIIVGAKGFAKEVLEILHQLNQLENVVFYDDISSDLSELLFDRFPIIKSIEAAKNYFQTIDNRFTIGIGNPILRKKMNDKFAEIGGKLVAAISPLAKIGNYGTQIGLGCTILEGSIISNDVVLGKGCIVYFNSIISHDCKIGDFVEISPAATILGSVQIDSYTQIGSNATILPTVKIGKNVIIGAGSVVTKDIPDNCVAYGIPAKVVKEINPLDF